MPIKIYLSGGTVTGWQNVVMDRFTADKWVDSLEFYNPAGLVLGPISIPELAQYGPMDRIKIEECDIAFGYLEKSNPTPINVALEMGLAKGLGKRTILCNEWTKEAYDAKDMRALYTNPEGGVATWFKPHYIDLLNSWMDFVEEDFGVAIEILRGVLEYEIG